MDAAPPLPPILAHVHCGQAVGWIEMKLGMEVGLGPGRIVLGGDPAPPKGTAPQFSACVCCDQTAGWIKKPLNWYGDTPRPRPVCVK